MAWDEDNNNRKKDPWRGNSNDKGPPDLDELVRRVKRKLEQSFGVKKSKSPVTNSKSTLPAFFSFGFIALALFVLWVISGVFIVKPAERGVILRFGKYATTVEPGPHWIPRFIYSKYIVNVQQISSFKYQAEMLTKDENIVGVDLSVQYRAANPREYLFNVIQPEESIQQATASALRQVIGHTTLDSILTTGREQVRTEVNEVLVNILSPYNTGLEVVDVNLEPAKPPEQVTEAFDDAVKAREDEQRYINQADAYSEKVTATLRGKIRRLLETAEADKRQIVEGSKADIAGYLAILPEYKSAPTVTRERLYLDTLEGILTKSSKVVVDVKGGNNMMYIPLDKLLEKHALDSNVVESSEVTKEAKEPKEHVAALPPPKEEPFSSRPTYPDEFSRGGYQWQE